MSYSEICYEIENDLRLASEGQLVLDIGCGTGLYSSVLKKNGNKYIGVDKSNSALEFARAKGINVVAGEAENISLGTESVDYVFSSEVIEHVSSPENMLKEIYRVLKPGGCGFITTTTYQFIIFHYFWVSSKTKFRVRHIFKYLIGYLSQKQRDEFVRLLYDFTGGHLWGFTKKDIIMLVEKSSLEIQDIYYFNVQPLIPFKLKGGGMRKVLRKIVEELNGILFHKKRAIYGPNIIVKFSKPNTVKSEVNN